MSFLAKVQQLPEKKRKIILWSAVIILAIALLFWWAKNLQQRVGSFQGEKFIEELELPEIEMPQMPEIDGQELEKLYGQ